MVVNHILFLFVLVLTAVVTPEVALVPRGDSAVFECVVRSSVGGSVLQYSWEYPLQSQANILVEDSVLTILSATAESEGEYTCTATDSDTGLSVSANATLELGKSIITCI